VGRRFYGFDTRSHQPLHDGVPYERRGALEDDAIVVAVPAGVAVVRTEDQRPPENRRGKPDLWWVVRDDPVLSGREIRNPEQNFDSGTGGQPIVTMEFDAAGRRAFADATRTIARRGADNAAINGGPGDPAAASHHFPIRLDDDLLSTPYIDFRENPDGIDGTTGVQIAGGFTIASARDLVVMLALPPLPVRVHVVSSSAAP
jgi:SecD/SecF fusion protein